MSKATHIRKAGPLAASALALGLMIAFTHNVMADNIIKTGTLTGQSDHVTTGTVSIVKEGDKSFLVLGPNFSLDGAPAPTLGFSKDGQYVQASEFSKLKQLTGEQRYELPKGFLASAYDSFTVWCSKFSVPLGSAKLK